jgi:hypothetical protein
MTSVSQHSAGASKEVPDPDATYRDDLVRVLGQLGLEPAKAVALVEATTRRPFETCSPTHLLPLLQELPTLVRACTTPLEVTPACRA